MDAHDEACLQRRSDFYGVCTVLSGAGDALPNWHWATAWAGGKHWEASLKGKTLDGPILLLNLCTAMFFFYFGSM